MYWLPTFPSLNVQDFKTKISISYICVNKEKILESRSRPRSISCYRTTKLWIDPCLCENMNQSADFQLCEWTNRQADRPKYNTLTSSFLGGEGKLN